MQITEDILGRAVEKGILAREQAAELWKFLSTDSPATVASGPGFTFTNVLYYFGGVLAIGAMTLFMTLGWQAFGGWGMFAISGIYCAIALWGTRLLLGKGFPTPAGILAALAIALVPLAIYGMENGLNMWPVDRPYRDYHYWVDWRWALMEIGSLLAGTIVLYIFRTPFAVMPMAITLWYMSMDFAPLLAGGEAASETFRKLVSMVFGVAMLGVAVYIDVRTRRRPDFAFWLYLFGTLAFWGALSLMDSGSQLGRLLYALLNAVMIFIGAILARRIFTVCGGIGVFGYLGYLSYSVFKDSILFPFALTGLGLILVVTGIWWQRHEGEIRLRFRGHLPVGLREALESA
ncbi:MAG TPA: hypothetical protein VKU01_32880 [Bryobacteraceae bacterium]|nr:hypothetical protein [Bryobacteraceae bacterium]